MRLIKASYFLVILLWFVSLSSQQEKCSSEKTSPCPPPLSDRQDDYARALSQTDAPSSPKERALFIELYHTMHSSTSTLGAILRSGFFIPAVYLSLMLVTHYGSLMIELQEAKDSELAYLGAQLHDKRFHNQRTAIRGKIKDIASQHANAALAEKRAWAWICAKLAPLTMPLASNMHRAWLRMPHSLIRKVWHMLKLTGTVMLPWAWASLCFFMQKALVVSALSYVRPKGKSASQVVNDLTEYLFTFDDILLFQIANYVANVGFSFVHIAGGSSAVSLIIGSFLYFLLRRAILSLPPSLGQRASTMIRTVFALYSVFLAFPIFGTHIALLVSLAIIGWITCRVVRQHGPDLALAFAWPKPLSLEPYIQLIRTLWYFLIKDFHIFAGFAFSDWSSVAPFNVWNKEQGVQVYQTSADATFSIALDGSEYMRKYYYYWNLNDSSACNNATTQLNRHHVFSKTGSRYQLFHPEFKEFAFNFPKKAANANLTTATYANTTLGPNVNILQCPASTPQYQWPNHFKHGTSFTTSNALSPPFAVWPGSLDGGPSQPCPFAFPILSRFKNMNMNMSMALESYLHSLILSNESVFAIFASRLIIPVVFIAFSVYKLLVQPPPPSSLLSPSPVAPAPLAAIKALPLDMPGASASASDSSLSEPTFVSEYAFETPKVLSFWPANWTVFVYPIAFSFFYMALQHFLAQALLFYIYDLSTDDAMTYVRSLHFSSSFFWTYMSAFSIADTVDSALRPKSSYVLSCIWSVGYYIVRLWSRSGYSLSSKERDIHPVIGFSIVCFFAYVKSIGGLIKLTRLLLRSSMRNQRLARSIYYRLLGWRHVLLLGPHRSFVFDLVITLGSMALIYRSFFNGKSLTASLYGVWAYIRPEFQFTTGYAVMDWHRSFGFLSNLHPLIRLDSEFMKMLLIEVSSTVASRDLDELKLDNTSSQKST